MREVETSDRYWNSGVKKPIGHDTDKRQILITHDNGIKTFASAQSRKMPEPHHWLAPVL